MLINSGIFAIIKLHLNLKKFHTVVRGVNNSPILLKSTNGDK
jgi:hypothetical protein